MEQWRQREAERDVVRKKIERLKKAKTGVVSSKKDAESAKTYIEKKMDPHEETWCGTFYNSVRDSHYDKLNPQFDTYYDDVDYILDAVCDEITRLENENRNLGIIINSIANSVNNLVNEIEKLLN